MFSMSETRKQSVSKSVDIVLETLGPEYRVLIESLATNCYLHGYNERLKEENTNREREVSAMLAGMEKQYGELELVK